MRRTQSGVTVSAYWLTVSSVEFSQRTEWSQDRVFRSARVTKLSSTLKITCKEWKLRSIGMESGRRVPSTTTVCLMWHSVRFKKERPSGTKNQFFPFFSNMSIIQIYFNSIVIFLISSIILIFRYQWTAGNAGTHFWHAHTGLQKMDGLYGSIVVRQPPNKDPNSNLYDYDLTTHVVLISDWMHEDAAERFPGRLAVNTGQDPETVLINGKGQFRVRFIINNIIISIVFWRKNVS